MGISTTPRPRGMLLVAMGLAVVLDCRPAVRRGPAETIEAVAHGVGSGRVSTAWKSLPTDWWTDVTGLVRDIAGHELQVDRQALDRNWGSTTTILKAITSSDARTLDCLARIDIGRFMTRTADPVFREMIRLADTVDGEPPSRLVALRNLAADTVSQDGDTAVLVNASPPAHGR
jgi:hypothetical protein